MAESKYIPYIISMSDASERRATVSEQFARKGIDICFVEAVNGKLLTDEEISRCYESIISIDGRTLSKGEIGCFLSHRKCWQKFLQTEKEWALIGEDDIYLANDPTVLEILEHPENFPKNVDLVQLGSYQKNEEKCQIKRKVKKLKEFDLVQMMKPISYGTQLYWLNRKAAKHLLTKTKKFSRTVDNYLFDQKSLICEELYIWTLSPFVAYQDDDPRLSSIAEDRKKLEKQIVYPPKEREFFLKKWHRKFIKKFLEKKYIRSFIDEK